ncbi:glyoxylate/hydroxypyruvate reductase A [Reinekea forsetii]|nr:glyoxylate/hydroxypyruvate reductase A [Reinekea forsetii]
MNSPIALVGELNEQQTNHWLTLLKNAMPDENIIAFEQLTEQQKLECEIAIVANPDPKDIAQLPNLIWLHSLWAGVEKLVAAFKNSSLNIVRLIDPNLTNAMSEAVLTWTLYLHRDMPHYIAAQKKCKWQSKPYTLPNERTVGVLGLGELGKSAAERLAENNFNVLGWSRSQKNVPGVTTFHGQDGLNQVLTASDILVILVPLTENTHNLINSKRIALMKPSSSIINFARGAIIETDSLLDALNKNKLNHAVLDVFEQEPLPDQSSLWQHEKITVLPHISAQTNPKSASEIVAKNIRTYRETNTVPPTVNLKVGY